MTKFYKEGEIMIGKSVPRVDAYEKVTGRAKFTDDLYRPDVSWQKFFMQRLEMEL